MADHPHAARYRKLMDAFNTGDMSAMDDALADDVRWWQIGASEPVEGKAALVAQMEGLGDWTIEAELHDVVGNDDHLIALVEARATHGDASLSYRTAEIMHIDDAGRITERWAFSDDTQRITEFFS